MASITSAQLAADLDFAIADFGVTLTTVLPTTSVDVEFTATKTTISLDFVVEDNGRETEIDSAFLINVDGIATFPEKGWVLNDGTRDLKVAISQLDAPRLLLKLDMVARRQR